MAEKAEVILSGFADEAANHKTAVEQFAAFAALGLEYYTVRFIDVGNGIKNVMKLTKTEVTAIRHLEDEYGMNVSSIGSPIGKVKLKDVDDGTNNPYVPFKKYLERDVTKACDLAHAFETKLIRGFSFYHPMGTPPEDHLSQCVDQLGQIAEACHRSDLTFGLEVEANLVGQNGDLLREIHQRVNHPALMLIFDGGNLVTQGFDAAGVFSQYEAMKEAIGWLHLKDYRHPGTVQRIEHVDEESLRHFVPAEEGQSGHEMILKDFAEVLPGLTKKLRRRGIPGVFIDLEPHLKGGGQFGGFSGPDGLGVALRSLCRILDFVGIDYRLRDFADVKASQGV
ncbi:MAG: TIM barrel protein [Pirellulales bacterium]|nr:TIM barrel protein [Pirellulales bacterium]